MTTPERELTGIGCNGQLSDINGTAIGINGIGLMAYICAKCDNTYLAIACEEVGLWLTLSLNPASAEALAAELHSPRIDPFYTRETK